MESNKLKEGMVEVAMKATNFKNACSVHTTYDKDVSFRFTPKGFSFAVCHAEQGEQYTTEFFGDRCYTYEYCLKYADGRPAAEIYIKSDLTEILNAPVFKGSAGNRQFRFHFKLDRHGKLVNKSIVILETGQDTDKFIPAQIQTPEKIIPDLYEMHYLTQQPNSKSMSNAFLDLIPENQNTYKGIEFILYSNGKVGFVKKNYLESYIIYEEKKKKEKKKDADKLHIEPVPLDQSLRCDFEIENEEPVIPIYSVSLSGTKYQTMKKFAKMDVSTVQFYMKKDEKERPLAIRLFLGSQGVSTIYFANMKPDEMESTPKKTYKKKSDAKK